jgi:hypothetical protein
MESSVTLSLSGYSSAFDDGSSRVPEMSVGICETAERRNEEVLCSHYRREGYISALLLN